MDPQQLFSDERFSGMCVYCGGDHETGDHVPSKVLLDEPFPDNLPLVAACRACNDGFSKDEPYLACLVECILAGSTDAASLQREKVRRILTSRPHFGVEIAAGRREVEGAPVWQPDMQRVDNVLLKLARGHAAYELAAPRFEEPDQMWRKPLLTMSEEQRQDFETPPVMTGWPEIGSRAFMRAIGVSGSDLADSGWQIVQAGRYRYLVFEGPTTVRMVLSEYLACEVVWD